MSVCLHAVQHREPTGLTHDTAAVAVLLLLAHWPPTILLLPPTLHAALTNLNGVVLLFPGRQLHAFGCLVALHARPVSTFLQRLGLTQSPQGTTSQSKIGLVPGSHKRLQSVDDSNAN